MISDDSRPLAPAPLPVLAGVVALCVLATALISLVIHNDWLAVITFVAVMFFAAWALNDAGEKYADTNPHPLYKPRRLPTDKSTRWIRMILILGTLVVLIAVVAATVKPGSTGSALPYLLAAMFLYLVMPQITARMAVRRYSED